MSTKPTFNSKRVQKASRINFVEGNRLDAKMKLFGRAERHMIHVVNNDLRLLSEDIGRIKMSSGTVSELGVNGKDVRLPCFLYGERISSRKYGRLITMTRNKEFSEKVYSAKSDCKHELDCHCSEVDDKSDELEGKEGKLIVTENDEPNSSASSVTGISCTSRACKSSRCVSNNRPRSHSDPVHVNILPGSSNASRITQRNSLRNFKQSCGFGGQHMMKTSRKNKELAQNPARSRSHAMYLDVFSRRAKTPWEMNLSEFDPCFSSKHMTQRPKTAFDLANTPMQKVDSFVCKNNTTHTRSKSAGCHGTSPITPVAMFARPSIYAQTVASRQRMMSSLIVCSNRKKKMVTSVK